MGGVIGVLDYKVTRIQGLLGVQGGDEVAWLLAWCNGVDVIEVVINKLLLAFQTSLSLPAFSTLSSCTIGTALLHPYLPEIILPVGYG
ncbi:hypothetical protein Tco_1484776 [Tanacetum coccineum]